MAETKRIEAILQELAVNVNPDFSNQEFDIPLNQYRIIGMSPDGRRPQSIHVTDGWGMILQFDAVDSHRVDPKRPGAWLDLAAIGFQLDYSLTDIFTESPTRVNETYDAEAEPINVSDDSREIIRTVNATSIRGVKGHTVRTSSSARESQKDLFKLLGGVNWAGALLYQAVETAKQAAFNYVTLISSSYVPPEVKDGRSSDEFRRTQSRMLDKRYDLNALSQGFKYDENTKLFVKNLKS